MTDSKPTRATLALEVRFGDVETSERDGSENGD